MHRLILNTHHLGDTRATNIRIHDADHILRIGRKGMRQQRSKRALPHSSLSTQHEDLVLHILQAGRDDGDVRIRTLRR